MSDKIAVPRFRSTDYHGNTPAAKREIYKGLKHDYIMQSIKLCDRANTVQTCSESAHILAQAAYAMRQASYVQRELDYMVNTNNTKGDTAK